MGGLIEGHHRHAGGVIVAQVRPPSAVSNSARLVSNHPVPPRTSCAAATKPRITVGIPEQIRAAAPAAKARIVAIGWDWNVKCLPLQDSPG
jgi:hypothetical protein